MSRAEFTGEFAWGSHKNYTQNKVANVGDRLQFRWSKRLVESDGAILTIRQESAAWDAVAYFPVIQGNLTGQNLTWTVTSDGFNLDTSNVFYMAIQQPDNAFAPSHYFNITNARSVSATSSTLSSPPITEPIASATNFNNPTSSTITGPTPTTTIVMQDDQGLKTGEIVGITIGVVACALILAVGIWLVFRHLKKRNQSSPAQQNEKFHAPPALSTTPVSELGAGTVGSELSGADTGGRYYKGEDRNLYYYELGGGEGAQEMEGNTVRRV